MEYNELRLVRQALKAGSMAMISPLRKQRDLDRKEKTYQDLLDAAIEAFGDKGYHGSLISDIVARAGVGQGTFYRHFNDKRELFDAIMDRFGRMLLGEFDVMTTHLPGNAEQYRKASRDALLAMAALVEKNRKLVLVLLREAPTVDREFEQRLNELFDQFASLAAFYLDYAVSQGFARPCNTGIVAQAIVGMALRHITKWLQNDPKALDIDELITELVDFAFFGFGA
ncbi:MAG: TetR/AcrR family transcriptional regulator [Myxococcales bacterium]|nr:MAG: TetR/AcrR family transcriptional regulator [Myxococcales bacterium]